MHCLGNGGGEATWHPLPGGTAGFNGIVGVISCDEFGAGGTGRVQISRHPASDVTDDAQLPVVYRFAP